MKFYFSCFLACVFVGSTLCAKHPVTKKPSATPEEDTYVQHFGKNPNSPTTWKVEDWYFEPGERRLRDFCAKAHKLAGYGDVSVEGVILHTIMLGFTNKNYMPRKIKIITYVVQPAHSGTPFWFLTEGATKDCIFYLELLREKAYGLDAYRLKKHVCGLVA